MVHLRNRVAYRGDRWSDTHMTTDPTKLPPPGPPELVYDGGGWGIERARRKAQEAWERGSGTVIKRTTPRSPHDPHRPSPSDRQQRFVTGYVDLGFVVEFTEAQLAFLKAQAEERDESISLIAWRFLTTASPELQEQVEAAATKAVDDAIAEGQQEGP